MEENFDNGIRKMVEKTDMLFAMTGIFFSENFSFLMLFIQLVNIEFISNFPRIIRDLKSAKFFFPSSLQ
jgi:hypothetical protein